MSLLNSVRQGVWTWLSGGNGIRLGGVTPYSQTVAGEVVTPDTAMGASAYYACIRNISEDLASKPLDVIAKIGERREPRDDHPVERLMNVEWNPEMGAMAAREFIQGSAMGWGNGWAEIERNGNGDAVCLWPIHPSRATLGRNTDGDLILRTTRDNGQPLDIPYGDVFHIHGFGDGLQGHSIASIGCESIGKALAQQKFGAAFFGNGATFGNVFEYPGSLTPTAKQNLKESTAQEHAGAGQAFKGFVLENGGKLSARTLGIPPEEAQLIESTSFSVEDLARWFRCPPHIIGHLARAQGWSTLEMQGMEYVTYVQMNWAIRWEQEIKRKLFRATEASLQAKHNFRALLRGDSNSFADYVGKLFRLGVINRNEMRALLDMNPVPGGEVYYIESSNLQPVQIGNDGASADLVFKRDVVKALIADGTIGDVIFNLTDGRKLLEEVNVPISVDAKGVDAEPWLPVVATAGPLVSGDTVTDPQGDIVGGAVEDEAGEPVPSNAEPAADSEPEQAATETSGADVVVSADEIASEEEDAEPEPVVQQPVTLFRAIVEDACQRVASHDKRSVHKFIGADCGDFYAKHQAYALKALAPISAAWTEATGKVAGWHGVLDIIAIRHASVEAGTPTDNYCGDLIASAMEDLTNA